MTHVPHIPLGVGASDHRPREATRMKQVADAEAAMTKALNDSSALLTELCSSPALKMLVDLLMKRITEYLREDEYSKALLTVLASYRQTLEWAPALAEQRLRQMMGPVLTAVIDGTQGAP